MSEMEENKYSRLHTNTRKSTST